MKRLVDELAETTEIRMLARSVMWRALLGRASNDPALVADLAERIRADRN